MIQDTEPRFDGALFDYLAVLLSVILSIALASLILGFSELIQMRRSVRPYRVQIIWGIAVILYVVSLWWGAFRWRHLADWETFEFLFLIGNSIAVALMPAMLFPRQVPNGFQFESFFFSNRRWFFGLLCSALALEALAKACGRMQILSVADLAFLPFAFALALAGWATANRRLHWLIAVAFVAGEIVYLLSGLPSKVASLVAPSAPALHALARQARP